MTTILTDFAMLKGAMGNDKTHLSQKVCSVAKKQADAQPYECIAKYEGVVINVPKPCKYMRYCKPFVTDDGITVSARWRQDRAIGNARFMRIFFVDTPRFVLATKAVFTVVVYKKNTAIGDIIFINAWYTGTEAIYTLKTPPIKNKGIPLHDGVREICFVKRKQ